MGECSGCQFWHRQSKSRGECEKRAGRGFGSRTSQGFGRKCTDYERRRFRNRPANHHKTKVEIHAELRKTRAELSHARGALARIDTSRAGLVRLAQRLDLEDVQWLRGELAVVAATKAREAARRDRS